LIQGWAESDVAPFGIHKVVLILMVSHSVHADIGEFVGRLKGSVSEATLLTRFDELILRPFDELAFARDVAHDLLVDTLDPLNKQAQIHEILTACHQVRGGALNTSTTVSQRNQTIVPVRVATARAKSKAPMAIPRMTRGFMLLSPCV
jgi:hypothetical protein